MKKEWISGKIIWFLGFVFLMTVMLSKAAMAGNTLSTAETISLGKTVTDSVSGRPDKNYYKINLPVNTVVHIEVKTTQHEDCLYVHVSNSAGNQVFQILATDGNNWGYASGEIYISLNKGTNYIWMDSLWSRSVDYTFSVKKIVGADANTVIAADGKKYLKDAQPLTIGQRIYDTEQEDPKYYRFTVKANQKIMLKARVLDNFKNSSLTVELLDAAGNEIDEMKANASTGFLYYGQEFTFTRNLTPGTYYLRVAPLWNHYTDCARYVINTYGSKNLAAPKLVSAVNEKNGVRFTWKSVSGAEGYQVYRKLDNGEWKKIATVKGKDNCSYLDKKAKNGKFYRYTVQAYATLSTGTYKTAGKPVLRLTQPTISSKKNEKGKKITLKWKKNSAASYYVVQYATNKNFKGAKSKKVTGTNTLTLSKLKKGKTYYLRVLTYGKSNGKKYVSAASAVKKVTVKK